MFHIVLFGGKAHTYGCLCFFRYSVSKTNPYIITIFYDISYFTFYGEFWYHTIGIFFKYFPKTNLWTSGIKCHCFCPKHSQAMSAKQMTKNSGSLLDMERKLCSLPDSSWHIALIFLRIMSVPSHVIEVENKLTNSWKPLSQYSLTRHAFSS